MFERGLHPRTDLAKVAGIAAETSGRTEFSLGHVVESRDGVDAVFARAGVLRAV